MSTTKGWPTLSSGDIRSSILLNSKMEDFGELWKLLLCSCKIEVLPLRFLIGYFHPFIVFLSYFHFSFDVVDLFILISVISGSKCLGIKGLSIVYTTETTKKWSFKKKKIGSICWQRNQIFSFISVDTTAKIAGWVAVPRVEFKNFLEAVRSLFKYLS